MRIAGGVLIIIVAVMDLLAGVGYAGFGAVVGVGATAAAKAAKEHGDADAQKSIEKGEKAGQIAGGMLAAFGFYLLALCGLGIACAVVLFMKKAATFALIVAILQLIAEGIGCFIFSSIGITNIFSIIAAIFVIIGALSYLGKSSPTPAAV
jgi:hypothetical protein